MLVFIWLVAVLVSLYLYMQRKHQFLKDLGINHHKPLPIFGNMLNILLRREHPVEQLVNIYRSFPEDRFVGSYEFYNPVIMIRDIELIKQIGVKDYEYFLDHRSIIDEENDPLFGRNLFSLKGQKWRDMRSTLSPAFTASKMKQMVPFMMDCCSQMLGSLKLKTKSDEANYIDLDTLDLVTRFANDVIASCAFGLKVNSITDETNEFYNKGKEATNFSFKQVLKIFISNAVPKIIKNQLKVTLFSKETGDFFRKIILGTMKNREENKIVRPDMIHLLMEAKKGNLVHDNKDVDENAGFATVEESSVNKNLTSQEWSDDDLVAQALIFFIAGFDTISTAITFMLYELAINPDIQDKLVQEIKDVNAASNGKIDYSTIQKLKYMDMVVSESLRMWTPAASSDRMCKKAYNIGRPNSKATQDVILQPGQGILFPIWALHRNPDFFSEPDKFDPERFSDENKHKIQPFTYLPFGIGPRNCIGSRFALIEVKLVMHQILSHFRLEPCAKTRIPAKLATETFNLRMQGGHWLRFRPRN